MVVGALGIEFGIGHVSLELEFEVVKVFLLGNVLCPLGVHNLVLSLFLDLSVLAH